MAHYDERFYAAAAQAGRQLWQIDAHESLITITVHRGGTLARFGHDHVLASRSANGYVAPLDGHAELYFRLDQLTVDEAVLRQAAGFETQPSDQAIEGTRHNLLTRVLDAQRFPEVGIDASRIKIGAPIATRITLNGVTRSQDVAAQVQENGAGIIVDGTMQILQSDFGIVPFSVLNGAIAVQDRLDLAFHLIAHLRR